MILKSSRCIRLALVLLFYNDIGVHQSINRNFDSPFYRFLTLFHVFMLRNNTTELLSEMYLVVYFKLLVGQCHYLLLTCEKRRRCYEKGDCVL